MYLTVKLAEGLFKVAAYITMAMIMAMGWVFFQLGRLIVAGVIACSDYYKEKNA